KGNKEEGIRVGGANSSKRVASGSKHVAIGVPRLSSRLGNHLLGLGTGSDLSLAEGDRRESLRADLPGWLEIYPSCLRSRLAVGRIFTSILRHRVREPVIHERKSLLPATFSHASDKGQAYLVPHGTACLRPEAGRLELGAGRAPSPACTIPDVTELGQE